MSCMPASGHGQTSSYGCRLGSSSAVACADELVEQHDDVYTASTTKHRVICMLEARLPPATLVFKDALSPVVARPTRLHSPLAYRCQSRSRWRFL